MRERRLVRALVDSYPDAKCELQFGSPWELLVATVLSAQSTDAQVNRVTPRLWRELGGPASLAAAAPERVEDIIRSLGMFRRKAASLQKMAIQVCSRHGGKVPNTLAELTALDGVGRKTANVVLGNVFDQPAITVDTHVGRLARRMGLSSADDPLKVERDLESFVPRRRRTQFSHSMIRHGRTICVARRPRCDACCVAALCPRVGLT